MGKLDALFGPVLLPRSMKIDNWKISAFNRSMQLAVLVFLLVQIVAGNVGLAVLRPEIHASLSPHVTQTYHEKVVEASPRGALPAGEHAPGTTPRRIAWPPASWASPQRSAPSRTSAAWTSRRWRCTTAASGRCLDVFPLRFM